jgi:hypothetical protein
MRKNKRSTEKERFWRDVVRRQRRGDLNVRDFCRRREISEPSFYAWRRELSKRDEERSDDDGNGAEGNGEGRLLPVKVIEFDGDPRSEPARGVHQNAEYDRAAVGNESKTPLEIRTPNGYALRFGCDADLETVARLLEVMRRAAGGTDSC